MYTLNNSNLTTITPLTKVIPTDRNFEEYLNPGLPNTQYSERHEDTSYYGTTNYKSYV